MSKLHPVNCPRCPPANIYGYFSYVNDTGLTLTTTPQLVTGYDVSDLLTPEGVTESDGVFTATKSGGVLVNVTRTYKNSDTNPSDEVDVTIDMRINGLSVFTNKLPIPPATNPGGDGAMVIPTTFPLRAAKGDYFEIYVSAKDDGADPENARLVRLSVTITPAFT